MKKVITGKFQSLNFIDWIMTLLFSAFFFLLPLLYKTKMESGIEKNDLYLIWCIGFFCWLFVGHPFFGHATSAIASCLFVLKIIQEIKGEIIKGLLFVNCLIVIRLRISRRRAAFCKTEQHLLRRPRRFSRQLPRCLASSTERLPTWC